MKQYEDHCYDCCTDGRCLGGACPYKNVPVYYCDKCGDELSERYVVDDEDYCEYCLKETFKKDMDE